MGTRGGGVGSKKEEMLVYVASIDDICLFNLDYLKKSGACLNFGDMTMSVCGKRTPLLEDGKCAEMVAAMAVHVSLRSETRVGCRLSWRMKQDDGLVELSLF